MVCPKCGSEIEGEGAFCPYCGTKLEDPPEGGHVWDAAFPCLLAAAMVAGALWWVWCMR